MKRPQDISKILRDWEYNSDGNVRFFTCDDGREVMQIRQPLGIEQYELDGRPDGLRPDNENTVLDIFLKEEVRASEMGLEFTLDDDDFRRLRDEGVLFYYRYLILFQMGYYDRVIRDTSHNLRIAQLMEDYYKSDQRNDLLQYRPYIHRINAIARAMTRLADDETSCALEDLEQGRKNIEALPSVPTPIFEFEKTRSLQHLSQVMNQVNETKPQEPLMSLKNRLTEQLSQAVESEDYENAARLRDRIKRLKEERDAP